jgi:cyclopropane fatty-acyl-phospholipid synthase-like methyltransferase
MTLFERYDALLFDQAIREFYNDDFYNTGWWDAETVEPGDAAANLVRRILEPVRAEPRTILEAGCGLGGSSRIIAQKWPNADIVSIGISERQVSYCRQKAAGSRRTFHQMDAVQLAFPPDAFDLVVSVEAAFHFNPRSGFFSEARRVLKHGGMLVLSDILVESVAWPGAGSGAVPQANFGTDQRRYAASLERAGFSDVRVQDATAPCWDAYIDRLLTFLEPRAKSGAEHNKWLQLTQALANGEPAGYILASAVSKDTL